MRALLLAVLATGCTGAMNEYFAQDIVDIEHDIDYVGDGNIRQTLDLYVPRGAKGDVPIVVFIHGDFWMRQDKSYYEPVTGLYSNVATALARHGIAAAIIDYRLVPSVTFEEEFSDVADAIKWVQRRGAAHGVDASQIVIAGHSAGGHMTALAAFDHKRMQELGVDERTLRGFAPLSPILDIRAFAKFSADDRKIADDVFGEDDAAKEAASPTTYFMRGAKPLLLLYGSDDLKEVTMQSERAATELANLGLDLRTHVLSGKDHDHVVLDFDTDDDAMTPLLADFVFDVTDTASED
ncbi:MAG TPA: alpha/beta hydrolase [Kofleriaceae bacterium]|jgi:acetyl esterase/lipase